MPAQAEQRQQQTQGEQVVIAAIVVILLSGLAIESLARHLAALLIPLGYPVQAIVGVIGLMRVDLSFDLDASPGTARAGTVRGIVVWRATYILHAVRRLAAGQSIEEERKFWRLHRGAERARRESAAAVDQAAAQFGPIIGWHSRLDDRTTPECRAAHGRNFRAAVPPAIGYPGTLHGGNCRCRPGRPWRNGKLLP